MEGVLPVRGRILRAASLVMSAFLFSRALGLVREIVIGRQFGTTWELDAYLAAFRVPDAIFQLMAGGALGSAFIPVFTGFLAQKDHRGAWHLASGVANLVGLLLTICAVLAAIFSPTLIGRVVAPGFSPEGKALATRLMRLMLVTPVIFGVSGIVMAVLHSHQHFLLPALAPSLYNLSIILGALVLAPKMGVYGLALGVVAGAGAHLAIQLPALVRRGGSYYPTLGLKFEGVREVVRLMLPRTFGLGVVQLNFLVNTILASRLAPGSLAALNYAWLLLMLPQGIFAMALGTAAFPTLSELVARDERRRMAQVTSETLRLVFYLAVPASIAMFLLRQPLIELLFQRGRFTTGSSQATAWALQFYAPGLFAYAGVEILSRAFYALHDTKTPVGVGTAAMALNVALSLALVGTMAQGGLALANTVATALEAVALAFLLERQLEGLELEGIAIALLRVVAAGGVMGLVTVAFLHLAGALPSLILVGTGLLLAAGTYLVVSWVVKCPEGRVIGQMVRSLGRLG